MPWTCLAITGVFAAAATILTASFFVASVAYGLRAARRQRTD